MQILSYLTETVLSINITRNRIVHHSKTVVSENHQNGDLLSDVNCPCMPADLTGQANITWMLKPTLGTAKSVPYMNQWTSQAGALRNAMR